jgi:Flp pilus assembly protein TadD
MLLRTIAVAGLLSLAGVSSAYATGGGGSRDSGAALSGAWARAEHDYIRGVAEIEGGHYAEGIHSLETYTGQVPDNADAENWLGFAYRKTGALDAAFAHYDRALTLDPRHRGAHEYLGEAYLLVGNLPKAEEHLQILENLCGHSCDETAMLRKSIDTYKSNNMVAVDTPR